MTHFKCVVFLIVTFSYLNEISCHGCLDENGQEVDWYVLYKLPKASHDKHPKNIVEEGLGFVQFTSLNYKKGWTLSEHSIGDTKSPPGQTLAPLYSNSARKDYISIFYNDEHPDGNTSFTHGHTKGVLAFGEKSGFWLVHSVPKYPPSPDTDDYNFPHTGRMFGQTFLCITVETGRFADDFGVQLFFNYPYIYSSNVPPFAKKFYPNLSLAAIGHHIKHGDPTPYRILNFFSQLSGIPFTSYAKFTDFHADLYADLVAVELRTGLLVETWPNGPGRMPSRCRAEFPVENISGLDFRLANFKTDNFTSRHDHAKWTISIDKRKSLLCIGDINRAETQEKRAGGTVCFVNNWAWKSFYSIIESVELCPKPFEL